jgi:two-component system phosphate regulon sensor histidine kinase PhoR
LWQQCLSEGEEQTASLEVKQRRSWHVIATPLQDVEPQACLIMIQDLTRLRQLETARRDFVSNVSHELRTPLASLKVLVETLRDGAMDDPSAAQRFLDRIETEVDDLTHLVQEMLELSRIESGQALLYPGPISVAEVVLPPVERLRPLAERAGLTLLLDLVPDLPPVLADLKRLQQVFTNLVHNAIKFTHPGGEVRVTARVGESEVVFTVHDTGIGIPSEDLPRIFERFYKADRARTSGGTGLGLAIAKHIVLAHGGRIWVESALGQGSAFYFTIPLAAG